LYHRRLAGLISLTCRRSRRRGDARHNTERDDDKENHHQHNADDGDEPSLRTRPSAEYISDEFPESVSDGLAGRSPSSRNFPAARRAKFVIRLDLTAALFARLHGYDVLGFYRTRFAASTRRLG
jgi:hypothetical protein